MISGNFAGSCSRFSITQNGIFSATCLKGNGGSQRSTITTSMTLPRPYLVPS